MHIRQDVSWVHIAMGPKENANMQPQVVTEHQKNACSSCLESCGDKRPKDSHTLTKVNQKTL